MIMPNEFYYQFDTNAIQGALDSAREAAAEQAQVATSDVTALDLTTAQVSEVTLQAACVSVTVRNRKVCLSLPLGFGSVCLPIPISIPEGEAASACLDIRTVWGFPTGVCVSVSALGSQIVRKCFP
jgi:hypothetical protein